MGKEDIEKTISQALRDAEESEKGLHRLASHLGDIQEQMIFACGYVRREKKAHYSDSEALNSVVTEFLSWCVCEAATSQALHEELCCGSLRRRIKSQEEVLADARKDIIKTGNFSLAHSALRGLELACEMYSDIGGVLNENNLQKPAANMSCMAGELKNSLERLKNTYKDFVFIPEQHFNCQLADDWHPWQSIREPLASIIISLPNASKVRTSLASILYKNYEGASEEQAKRLNNAIALLLNLKENYERAKS